MAHREQRRVLVLGWVQDPASFERDEVAGRGQTHERAAERVPRVHDQVLVAYLCDSRILYTPMLLEPLGFGSEPALGLDLPARESVSATRHDEP